MADTALATEAFDVGNAEPSPDISVVVCSQQRAEALRAALRTLYALETDGRFTYEVVVVDNASTDHTPQVIADAAGQSPNPVRGVFEGRKGISVARNRGVREAQGRWIAFFDDDQAAHPRWLAELWRVAQEKQVRHVAGAVALRLPPGCTRQLDTTCGMLLGESPRGGRLRQLGGKFNPGAGNWLIERTIFDEVGLFDESIGARHEDTNLYRRAAAQGIHGWFVPTAVIDHIIPEGRLEPAYLLKLARGIGVEVVEHEFNDASSPRFVVRWLAKAARMALLYVTGWIAAGLLRRKELQLGLRCRVALSWAHFREGWRLLTQSCRNHSISASPASPARSANV
jgi:glycosyltransferase involved in cell wall biosynthesis